MSTSYILNHDQHAGDRKPAPTPAPAPVATPTAPAVVAPAQPVVKYDLMTLFQRDGRPDIVMSLADFKAGKFDKDSTYMLHGKFSDANDFAKYAEHLAYGTVLLIFGFPEEEYEKFHETIGKFEFREWDKFGLDQDGRAWIKSHYDGGTFGTHWPYLAEAVKRTAGKPVLELGAGHSSTPALHELCKKLDSPLFTLDNNEEWLKEFEPLLTPATKGSIHTLEHCIDPAMHKWLDTPELGVVFVDHSPGESRRHAIERVRNKADYIVCHDSEEMGYGMEEALATFKFRKDFKYARPWTTVVSMTKEIFSAVNGCVVPDHPSVDRPGAPARVDIPNTSESPHV